MHDSPCAHFDDQLTGGCKTTLPPGCASGNRAPRRAAAADLTRGAARCPRTRTSSAATHQPPRTQQPRAERDRGADDHRDRRTDLPATRRRRAVTGLVIQGGKRTVSGDRVFDYAAGEFLIAQLHLPVVGQVTAASAEYPFLGIGIRIDPSQVAAILLDSAAIPAAIPARAPGIAVASSKPRPSSMRSRTHGRASSTPRKTHLSWRPSTGAKCSGGS